MSNNVVHLWTRRGFKYYAFIYLYRNGRYCGTITKELDFITYNFIRLVYGTQKLIDMASNYDGDF